MMPGVGCIMTEETFSLVFIHHPHAKVQAGDVGEWKIDEAPRVRAADVPAAIKYVQEMGGKSNDPVVKRNAARTIKALKRLTAACGVPNPC